MAPTTPTKQDVQDMACALSNDLEGRLDIVQHILQMLAPDSVDLSSHSYQLLLNTLQALQGTVGPLPLEVLPYAP